jgi:hypothetical protein
VGNNPQADGGQVPAKEVSDYRDTYGFLAADRHGMEEYIKYLTTDPMGFLRLQGLKTIKFFSVVRTTAWYPYLTGIARTVTFFFSAGCFAILLITGTLGMLSAIRRGPALARILSALALSAPAVAIPIAVGSRLRYPIIRSSPFWARWRFSAGAEGKLRGDRFSLRSARLSRLPSWIFSSARRKSPIESSGCFRKAVFPTKESKSPQD